MTQTEGTRFIEHQEDTQKDKFLTFKLCNESYGLEIRCVTEIIGQSDLLLIWCLKLYQFLIMI
jgi:purine-binding chemotaxis protein CheW